MDGWMDGWIDRWIGKIFVSVCVAINFLKACTCTVILKITKT